MSSQDLMDVPQVAGEIVPLRGDQLEVTLLMDEGEARQAVAQIRDSFENARVLIDQLKEREGWKVLGYKSWRECVAAEFGQSQAYLYRQLAAAQIERLISPSGEIGRIPEAHLRPLAKLPEVERVEVWQEIVETAPDGAITGKHAAAVVERRLKGEDAALVPSPSALKKDKEVGVVVPELLEEMLSAFLGYRVGDAVMPPAWPWDEGGQFVNLLSCKDLELWVERAIAVSEKGKSVILWVPAATDQDWFRRLKGCPLCFISARWLSECGLVLKQPSVLASLGRGACDFLKEFRVCGEFLS